MPSLVSTVEEGAGLRLDRYAAETLGLFSRSQVKARGLRALVNGREVKVSRILKAGEKIELFWEDDLPPDLVPENLPLDILYEDEHAAVINKAQGMVVHPGAGNPRGTLANALLYRALQKGASPGGAPYRPGIVHRLDKDTSGVIIAAWDAESLAFLAEEFKARRVRKTYAAIVKGVPREQEGRIEARIIRDPAERKRFTVSPDLGRPSLTFYRVIRSWGSHSLLLLRPKTGRTHQLRVHLRYLGHPILGDPVYTGRDSLFPHATLMLHAASLAVTLPGAAEESVFRAPLPERFRAFLSLRFVSGMTKKERNHIEG